MGAAEVQAQVAAIEDEVDSTESEVSDIASEAKDAEAEADELEAEADELEAEADELEAEAEYTDQVADEEKKKADAAADTVSALPRSAVNHWASWPTMPKVRAAARGAFHRARLHGRGARQRWANRVNRVVHVKVLLYIYK